MKGFTLGCFMYRAFHWFKKVYGFHFDTVMSDNGMEFKGNDEHPVEMMLKDAGVEHIYTPPYYPQPNGKVEAFFKIVQNEFIRPHTFKDIEEFKEQLGDYIYDYNHRRPHGGIDRQTPFKKLEKVTQLLT